MKSQVKFVCSVCFHQLCRCPKGEVSTLTHSIVPLPQSLTCSVQSLDRLGHRGDMRDDSVETLFQSFPQKARVSSSGMGRDVHSLMLSIQHFLFRPQHCSPSEVLWRKVLESLLWCVTSSLWSLMHMICTYVLMQWSQDSKRVHLFRRQLGLSCGIFCFMSGVCREQSAHLVHWIQCGIWQVLVLFSRSVLVRSKKKITLHFCSDLSNDYTSEHTHTQCCFCFLLPTLSFCLHDCGSGKCYSVKKGIMLAPIPEENEFTLNS